MALKDVKLSFEPTCTSCIDTFNFFIQAERRSKKDPHNWVINNKGISPDILIGKSTGFYNESGHIGLHYKLAPIEASSNKEEGPTRIESNYIGTTACKVYK